ncbi:hypothetical protein TNIN_291501 [Trichonephila inaurata madagascariensis]|uniref:Uncharacterized protein n=1 Tax=Trichonephila inaurata madagascariensis TaxID=2747483 RepID=A0A8X7CJR1_9ARAC|nr:hypothetical protein TNIN_291501 [Trichonephila inaurata madagascariensis]
MEMSRMGNRSGKTTRRMDMKGRKKGKKLLKGSKKRIKIPSRQVVSDDGGPTGERWETLKEFLAVDRNDGYLLVKE